MRVLEAGGTVEQHKAAVAAATAIKFDGRFQFLNSLPLPLSIYLI